ncbi:hypothetical protein N5D52_20725 [Pseudomonas sp. GD03860]|uniref:hypothetical protein n=1 Tax=Pseudomonas TaxID=286 RepID=UPI0023639C67|nr:MULTISPECIES: hypothetical protein [Pseudomonas]MDD2059064.1 hypothetical protein [Pseudomonas putida]MDH0639359.1 hypothetical protein [Pseudomonas sp. GD03860]
MKTLNLNVDLNGMSYIGYAYSKLPLAAALVVAAQQIDEAADAARVVVLGDPLRALEYECAASEAKNFAAVSYSGEMPPSVKSWAEAAGLEPQAATDSIIAKADAWSAALYSIRDARLKGKHAVARADSHEQAEIEADKAISKIKLSVTDAVNFSEA